MDFKRSAGANLEQFYIGGRWVDPIESGRRIEVVNPSDERAFASVAAGTAADVDRAVVAARAAFPGYAETPVAQRRRILERILNYPDWDNGAPFGGYKRSGNGREYAEFGLEDYLEIKGIIGHGGERHGS
jgi:acyl-CoA reductase-like NAD-dependent aldehyde dehydrogenase